MPAKTYLMCPPEHFTVSYAINPWMTTREPVGAVLGARFRHPERAPQGPAYLDWFRAQGYRPVHEPRQVNEGEGDTAARKGRDTT